MKITKVRYRTSAQVEAYQHRHVEAEAEVGAHEDPATALQKLREWVHGQLYDTITVTTVERRARRARRD